jgi:outer membrane protein TolC
LTRALPLLLLPWIFSSCQTPREHLEDANRMADAHLQRAQQEALGRQEDFEVRPSSDALRLRLLKGQDLPTMDPASFGLASLTFPTELKSRYYLESQQHENLDPLPSSDTVLDLRRVLMVAAANSREYQTQKEKVFKAALALDLEHDAFKGQWSAQAQSEATTDLRAGEDFMGLDNSASTKATLKNRKGMKFSSGIGIDLVKLLSFGKTSSLGFVGDVSVSIPLLRGSSSFVVSEPLRQAERNLIYAIYNFEKYKQDFAVDIATTYLDTLAELDRIETSAENYRSLLVSTRRARRLADAGRLPEIQVDQAHQNELKARQSWVSATQAYQRRLDQFKLTLGLPVDAQLALDPTSLVDLQQEMQALLGDHLATLQDQNPSDSANDANIVLKAPTGKGGPWEWEEDRALRTALDHRYDLRVALGAVHDAMRLIVVAEDDLRADLTLLGSGQIGASRSLSQAGLANAQLRPNRGSYSLLASLDLPLHRISERNTYRNSWINLESSLRQLQNQEDQVKLNVRNDLRALLEAREQALIQSQSLTLAERRVNSTELFLQAGRAEIRDLLDAQESLVSSRNAKTTAMIRYKSAEWQLQANLGLLQIGPDGLWADLRETPDEQTPEDPKDAE